MTELSNLPLETASGIVMGILLLVIFLLCIYVLRLRDTALSTSKYIYSLEDSIKTSSLVEPEPINIDNYVNFSSNDFKKIVEFRLEADSIDELNKVCLSSNYPRAVLLRAIVLHYLLNRQK